MKLRESSNAWAVWLYIAVARPPLKSGTVLTSIREPQSQHETASNLDEKQHIDSPYVSKRTDHYKSNKHRIFENGGVVFGNCKSNTRHQTLESRRLHHPAIISQCHGKTRPCERKGETQMRLKVLAVRQPAQTVRCRLHTTLVGGLVGCTGFQDRLRTSITWEEDE
jgi:hypothetical protein